MAISQTDDIHSKYARLIGILVKQIENNIVKPGDRLPPVRTLAYQMGMAPGTVARAYKELITQGYLEAGVGQGTYVRKLKPSILTTEVDVFHMLSPRLPDIGQVDLIRRGYVEFANHAGFTQLMAYPTRLDTSELQSAYLNYMSDVPLGQATYADVVITHGGQHGGVVTMQTIRNLRSGVIVVEELSYPGFRQAAELVGVPIVPVKTDGQGIDPADLDRIVRSTQISAIFTSAEVNNPTTLSTTNERRVEIADLAKKYGFHIIEDDCYRAGKYAGISYRSIAPELAWYVTSFSKTISPALRIGCVVCPNGMAPNLQNTVFFNSLGISRASCEVATYVLRHPKIAEVQAMISEETNRYILQAVNRLGQFDVKWRDYAPLLWLNLPKGWRTAAFCQAAQERGVLVSPADAFTTRGGTAPQAVRLSVNAEHGLDRFLMAIDTLVDLLRLPVQNLSI